MPPKVIVAGADAHQRRLARGYLGPLRHLRIAHRTLTRYTRAVQALQWWAFAAAVAVPGSWEELDAAVAQYMEHLWQEGEPLSLATDTCAGVQHFMGRKKFLPGSWDLLKTWRRRELPRRALPFPISVVLGLAGLALYQGRVEVCATLLTGFHCMLRSIEMCSFTPGDIALDGSFRGALSLGLTKGGQRRGAAEVVVIDDENVGAALAVACRGRDPRVAVCVGGPPALRAWMKDALVYLGLGHLDFRLYSIRRGGATFDFTESGRLDRTVFRGRWEAAATARIYITEGQAQLAQLAIEGGVATRLNDFARYLLWLPAEARKGHLE